MVPLYLDENLAKTAIARQLQAAGFTIYAPQHVGTRSVADPSALETATRLDAVLVTYDQADFEAIHNDLQGQGDKHAGILLSRVLAVGQLTTRLERAARLLTRSFRGTN